MLVRGSRGCRVGSSPRVRGAPPRPPAVRACRGLIPARAGSARQLGGVLDQREGLIPARAGSATPRSRGERLRRAHPPRVRGAPHGVGGQGLGQGLISARAGSATSRSAAAVWAWAHPRACGEREHAGHGGDCLQGPSPRVRGARDRHPRVPVRPGLIPARAGSATRSPGRAARAGAHPRACGERSFEMTSLTTLGAHPRACGERPSSVPRVPRLPGSSPRVRGARTPTGRPPSHPGLIPARAGSAPPPSTVAGIPRAHPRACGERIPIEWVCPRVPGSSPRVRGAPGHHRRHLPHRGLIPARAGSATARSAGPETGWAHPRACGERLWQRMFTTEAPGSSPRVRGAPTGRRR